MSALTDNMLLERIGQGDIASFETLFYRHYDRVYGLLFRLLGNRVEAEDVTQELFLKLYRRPLKKKLFGSEEHNVSAWLYRVATNMGYNHIRSRKRRWQRNVVLVPDSTDALPDPADDRPRPVRHGLRRPRRYGSLREERPGRGPRGLPRRLYPLTPPRKT